MRIVRDINQRLSRTRTELLDNGAAFFLLLTSNPCNGSSKIIRSGSLTNARAKSANLCSPEESVRKRTVFQLFNTEYTHPGQSYLLLPLRAFPEQPDRVKKSGTDDIQYRHILHIEKSISGETYRYASLYSQILSPEPRLRSKDKAYWPYDAWIIGINKLNKVDLQPRSDRTTPLSPRFSLPNPDLSESYGYHT